MTTLAQLRKAALALPEVTEGTHAGTAAFAVRGRTFASVTAEGHVELHMADEDAEAELARLPTGARLVRTGAPIGLRVPLADVNGQVLNRLVRASWSSRAPERLAAALADVDAGHVPESSDLPKAIGRPATRALLQAGITTLDDVARLTEKDLLALHGVGPRAVRLLAEALAERGPA